jgi:hypothetical protein
MMMQTRFCDGTLRNSKGMQLVPLVDRLQVDQTDCPRLVQIDHRDAAHSLLPPDAESKHTSPPHAQREYVEDLVSLRRPLAEHLVEFAVSNLGIICEWRERRRGPEIAATLPTKPTTPSQTSSRNRREFRSGTAVVNPAQRSMYFGKFKGRMSDGPLG